MEQPIPIRAHQILCLLGYRGEGYSVTFVAEMSGLVRELREQPERQVRLLTSADRLCQACIHLRRGGCTLGGPDHETHMRRQDEDVLARLGLAPEGVYSWNLIKGRVAASIRSADLPSICTTCPWLHLGWCAEGVEDLHREDQEGRRGGAAETPAPGSPPA